MNSIVLTVVVPNNIRMDRMRELGAKLASGVRQAIKDFEADGTAEKSEMLFGTPGYGLVLGMKNNAAHPDR